MLVISSGCSAALALMAAACGASCVVCMEGSQLTYRMAIQLLQANRHVPGHGNVQVGTDGVQGPKGHSRLGRSVTSMARSPHIVV